MTSETSVKSARRPYVRPMQGWWKHNDSPSASQRSWFADGRIGVSDSRNPEYGDDLLPPPPRKVKHMATLFLPVRSDGKRDHTRKPSISMGNLTSSAASFPEFKLLLLTGETEENWT